GSRRATGSGVARGVWRVLLPKRESEDVADAPKFPAGADRWTVPRIRGRGCAGRRVRADDSHSARRRRQEFLHQQPACRPCPERVEDDSRKSATVAKKNVRKTKKERRAR